MNPLHALLALALLADKAAPEAKDVKAGWLAFGIFLLLIGATVVLCFSFVKQLRKAQAAKDAGAYGDEPVSDEPVSDQPASPDDEVRGS
jgi:threonine/homoserine/homoserine lactone efflux protein